MTRSIKSGFCNICWHVGVLNGVLDALKIGVYVLWVGQQLDMSVKPMTLDENVAILGLIGWVEFLNERACRNLVNSDI
jgi:hypothetical protein